MKTQLIRDWAAAAGVALSGIALMAVAACSPAHASAAAANAAKGVQQQVAAATGADAPVVVDCGEHGQIQPGQYILACGDGGGYISGLHWAAWGSSAAFADGTFTINNGDSFPVLADLWRAEPRPGHAGQRYFTELTLIFTGNRSYTEGGSVHQFPATLTYPLSASGGA